MKDLPTIFLFSATLFSIPEPGQFAPNWLQTGSNDKGNHVEQFAKPPPVVFRQVSQIAPAQNRPQSRPHARDGEARIAADAFGHAAAIPFHLPERRRKAT